jgi:hypothetical protein
MTRFPRVTKKEIEDYLAYAEGGRNWVPLSDEEIKREHEQIGMELALLEQETRRRVIARKITEDEGEKYIQQYCMQRFKEGIRELMVARTNKKGFCGC